MKDKLLSKSFWLGIIGAALVFMQALGIKVDAPAVNEIASAVLTLLVVFGIISGGKSSGGGTQNPSSETATENKSPEEEHKIRA